MRPPPKRDAELCSATQFVWSNHRFYSHLVAEPLEIVWLALIHKDAYSDYSVSFPDLPGVVTAGSNLDEARKMAAEALAFHLEGLAEDGEAVPELSSLEEIMAIAEK